MLTSAGYTVRQVPATANGGLSTMDKIAHLRMMHHQQASSA